MRQKIRLVAGDALIVVDVQNDFLPGGSLAVPCSNKVIPALNRYVARFAKRHLPIYVTRDWHPADHCSFKTEGGQWPVHCVADSQGAQFASELVLPPWTVVISKGIRPDREACSGFEGTDLENRLRGHSIRRLFVAGLASDHCVLNTVQEALARGFSVLLLRDAICAMNVKPADGRNAKTEMVRLGARSIQLKNLST